MVNDAYGQGCSHKVARLRWWWASRSAEMRGAVKLGTTLAQMHTALLKLGSLSNEHTAGLCHVLAKQAPPLGLAGPPKLEVTKER